MISRRWSICPSSGNRPSANVRFPPKAAIEPAFDPLRTLGLSLIVARMPKQIDLDGLEAARQMAGLSPETQRRFDKAVWRRESEPGIATMAFHAIGVAIGSKRDPVSSANKKKLFAFAEQLLKHGSGEVSNTVATCLLEQIWRAAQTGGFDFADVDPYLGPEARRYLIAWDDFNRTKTEGLRRK